MITRAELAKQIVRAGQLRAIISMSIWVGSLILLSMLAPFIGDGAATISWLALCLLVPWSLTYLICHRLVKCPVCGSSLWRCGTGNVKPRRLRLKDNIDGCPSCHTKFHA